MSDETERMQILNMIENGKISAEDGLTLLRALVSKQDDVEEEEDDSSADEYQDVIVASNFQHPSGTSQPFSAQSNENNDRGRLILEKSSGEEIKENEDTEFSEQKTSATVVQPASSLPIETQKWRNFWMIPFWIGVFILVIGGVLMYWTLESRGVGVTFIFATLPFLLGLGIILLSWQSRTSPWIHLRITQAAGEKPEHIALSFPLPIRPALWFFRTFSGHIPKMQDVSLDEILIAVNQSTSADNPIYIQVDEGDKGEKVEIYIG